MKKDLSNRISALGTSIIQKPNSLSVDSLKKAGYDKTLIGFVSDQQTKDDGTVQWEIQTEGAAYMIDAKKSNITTVGQRVRLYLPNHDYRNKYAEVITDYEFDHPSSVEYDSEKCTVTETWLLSDKTEETRVFTLTVKDKGSSSEEVTAITFPDGSVMSLKNF